MQGSGESSVSRLGSLSHSQSSQRCPNSTHVAPKTHPAPLWGLWAAPSPLPWVSLSSLPLGPFLPFCRVWSQDPGTRLRPGTSTMALSRPLALSKPPWSQLGGWLSKSLLTLTLQASWQLELCSPFSLGLHTPFLSGRPPTSPSPHSALPSPAHPPQNARSAAFPDLEQTAGWEPAAQSFAKGPPVMRRLPAFLVLGGCPVLAGPLPAPFAPPRVYSSWLFSSSH